MYSTGASRLGSTAVLAELPWPRREPDSGHEVMMRDGCLDHSDTWFDEDPDDRLGARVAGLIPGTKQAAESRAGAHQESSFNIGAARCRGPV